MPIKANQISPEVRVFDALSSPPTPGADQGIFYPKKFGDVVDACFKNNQGSEIRLTVDGVPAGEANIAANVGSGMGIFSTKSGIELRFKTIKAGDGIAITAYDANTIQIASTVVAGETNDGENIGVTGHGVFKIKDGTTKRLQFKKLVAGQNIDVVDLNDTLTISVSNLAQNVYTASNVGTGEGNVFKEIANNDLKFKRIKAGNNTTVTETSTEITISSTGGVGSGEANTASNSAAGTGLGLFKQKVGTDLVFKKLKAGAGLALTSYDDDLEINLSGGLGEANTASNSTAGTGTGLLFKGKTLTDLVFRKLKAGANVTITTGTDDITIDAIGGGGTAADDTAYNATSWDGVTTVAPSKNAIRDKIVSMDASILTATNHAASAHAPATAEANTASNSSSGTGTGTIFKGKVSADLVFKKIKAGTNITITNGTDDITIDAAGGGGTSQVTAYKTADSGNIAIRASGLQTDIDAISAIKDFSVAGVSRLLLTVSGTAKLQSVDVTFTAAETAGRTEMRVEFAEPNGATSLDKAVRPFMIRYNSTYGVGGTSSTATMTGSTVVLSMTGYTAGSEQKAKVLF